MKTVVLSYSYTGNNEALAAAVAASLSAEHLKVTEAKPRKMGTIIGDMLFNRVPKSQPSPDVLAQYDRVILMGPVWMGKAASPLRAYLKAIKNNPQSYVFACVSGGSLNPNPKLKSEIAKRAGAQPDAFIDLHIADLMPEKKASMDDMGTYHLNAEEVQRLSGMVVEVINHEH